MKGEDWGCGCGWGDTDLLGGSGILLGGRNASGGAGREGNPCRALSDNACDDGILGMGNPEEIEAGLVEPWDMEELPERADNRESVDGSARGNALGCIGGGVSDCCLSVINRL